MFVPFLFIELRFNHLGLNTKERLILMFLTSKYVPQFQKCSCVFENDCNTCAIKTFKNNNNCNNINKGTIKKRWSI